ncbi:hypothetical protein ACIA8K_22365 [Catenuloplanes sp. NPDC051500]|uniref:hypothetical protein n=1 Tax=Catenuloplanes sp. NPDC051500 TaxID=3363959 RepID=UPI003799F17E
MAITGDLSKIVDKEYQDKSLEEIAAAPVAALAGISEAGAKHLRDALGIKTIGELGRNKYFRASSAIVDLLDAK